MCAYVRISATTDWESILSDSSGTGAAMEIRKLSDDAIALLKFKVWAVEFSERFPEIPYEDCIVIAFWEDDESALPSKVIISVWYGHFERYQIVQGKENWVSFLLPPSGVSVGDGN